MKKTNAKRIYCLDICQFGTYTYRCYIMAVDEDHAVAKWKQMIAGFTPDPDFTETAIITTIVDDIAGF